MKKNQRTITFIISLLLHLLLLLIFGFYAFRKMQRLVLTPTTKQLPQKTVVFFEPPASAKLRQAQPKPEPKKQPPPPKPKPEPKKQPPPPKPKPEPKKQPPPKPISKPPDTSRAMLTVARPTKIVGKDVIKPPDADQAKEEKILQPKPVEKKPVQKQEPPKKQEQKKELVKKEPAPVTIELPLKPDEIKKLALENLLKKKPQEKPASAELPPSPKLRRTGQRSQPKEKHQNNEEQKEERTKKVFALTKTILHSIAEDGNSVINRLGDPNKMPSFEELKYISYEQRLQEHMLSTWRILHAHNPLHNPLAIKKSCRVIPPLIDKDGSLLEDIQIIESSGSAEFDSRVIECFKKSSPFPPIPEHFGLTTYRMQGGVQVLK